MLGCRTVFPSTWNEKHRNARLQNPNSKTMHLSGAEMSVIWLCQVDQVKTSRTTLTADLFEVECGAVPHFS